MPSSRKSAGATPVRVLVADDDPLVRAAVDLLLQAGGRYTVAGEARDGAEALAKVRELQPQILLLDLNMPNKAGLDALREMGGPEPAMRTIVLTVSIEKRQVLEALQLGARGIVLKSQARESLLPAMQAVEEGRYWLNGQVHDSPQPIIHELSATVRTAADSVRHKLDMLSAREKVILGYIVEGRTNRDIANEMQTSEQVVKNHLGKIFDKFGVFNRLELALYAIDNGLVERQ